jgi:hypothetical protein
VEYIPEAMADQCFARRRDYMTMAIPAPATARRYIEGKGIQGRGDNMKQNSDVGTSPLINGGEKK